MNIQQICNNSSGLIAIVMTFAITIGCITIIIINIRKFQQKINNLSSTIEQRVKVAATFESGFTLGDDGEIEATSETHQPEIKQAKQKRPPQVPGCMFQQLLIAFMGLLTAILTFLAVSNPVLSIPITSYCYNIANIGPAIISTDIPTTTTSTHMPTLTDTITSSLSCSPAYEFAQRAIRIIDPGDGGDLTEDLVNALNTYFDPPDPHFSQGGQLGNLSTLNGPAVFWVDLLEGNKSYELPAGVIPVQTHPNDTYGVFYVQQDATLPVEVSGGRYLHICEKSIYVPANAEDGVTFRCNSTGDHTVTILGGAYTPFPEHYGMDENSRKWRTFLTGYVNVAQPDWGNDNQPQNGSSLGCIEPDSGWDREAAQQCGLSPRDNSQTIFCVEGQYLRFVAKDVRGQYSDNFGGIILSIQAP